MINLFIPPPNAIASITMAIWLNADLIPSSTNRIHITSFQHFFVHFKQGTM